MKHSLKRHKIRQLFLDAELNAAALKLVYVSDCKDGISRVKKGNEFIYLKRGKKIKDAKTLERIRKLVIPPAWTNVWICSDAKGHLQVTGTDVRGRKQYKYHSYWTLARNQTKFYRLYDFGKTLPRIRKTLEADLSLRGLPLKKVLATVVSIMERTSIRIGSNLYEKLYGSFGLTTLKDQHVKISGDQMQFVFRGKKGIHHKISLRNKKLAKIVKQCRDIPGQELFQYFDEAGQRHCIDSGMVNEYIRDISGSEFTAKDFRTWAGSVQALLALEEQGYADNQNVLKKKVVAALDAVAVHLGNTRSVCRKYYVHPLIIDLYEKKSLYQYTRELQKPAREAQTELACEEKALLRILEKESLMLSA